MKGEPGEVQGINAGLPAIVYGLMSVDRLLLPDLPELRIVAAFGMGFMAAGIIRFMGFVPTEQAGTSRISS